MHSNQSLGGGRTFAAPTPAGVKGLPLVTGAFFFTIALIGLCSFLSVESLRYWLPLVYAVDYILLSWLFVLRFGTIYALLRPTGIAISYFNISFVLGAWTFGQDKILNGAMVWGYESWSYLHAIVGFFLLSNWVLYIAAVAGGEVRRNLKIDERRRPFSHSILFIICNSVVLLVLLAIEVPYVGVIRPIVALSIGYALIVRGGKFRWAALALLIVVLAAFSENDKRNAIFLVLPFFWLDYALVQKRGITAKVFLGGLLAAAGLFYLIVAMSIMRGYGQYNPANFFEALSYVPDYMLNSYALSYFASNFEYGTVFFHSHNALNLIFQDSSLLAYGESLLKALFVGVPQSLFGYKPASILDLYTGTWDPGFRSVGGSFPIIVSAEMFWNFSWLGLIPLFLFMVLADRFYAYVTYHVRGWRTARVVLIMAALLFYLMYVRGSGLDIFVAYMLIAVVVTNCVVRPMDWLRRNIVS